MKAEEAYLAVGEVWNLVGLLLWLGWLGWSVMTSGLRGGGSPITHEQVERSTGSSH